jgi:glycosyltransferase involved in cell wall biosynthesis
LSIRVAAITFDWYPFDPLVRRFAAAAIDAGYEVDVICIRQDDEPTYEVYNGVRVYRLPMNRGFGLSLPATIASWCHFMLIAGIMVTKLHLRQRYDVIHVHNMPDFLVFAALGPKLLGAKVILHVQDVAPELMAVKAKGQKRALVQSLAVLQERISTLFADHVITVGWPFEKLLLKRGVPKQKMSILLNSADPHIFPPERRCPSPADSETAQPDQSFILMYHGTLAERNGLDTAIRALVIARQTIPHVRLDIKGRGEYLPQLKQLATELGVSEHVIFSDPCPSNEIVDFVLHGDVGIIPYRNDGFMELVLPTKAYEFAWMQRPIIASDTPAIRSMFRAESIVLCEAMDANQFAAAIVALYEHPEKRHSMVQSAAEDYAPYQWESMAQQYQQLLATLCHKEARKMLVPAESSH